MESVRVSVVVIAYNHEKYIREAVESVLAQKIDGGFEILVSEDASQDRTREILHAIQAEYPDRIHLLLSQKNMNSGEVLTRALKKCRGRYLAYLDGDDYWISDNKLQRQAEFLDEHPECSISFHNVWDTDENGRRRPHNRGSTKPMFTLRDLLSRSLSMAACSVMYRLDALRNLPPWHNTIVHQDLTWQVCSAQHGNVGYISDFMAVYRIHHESLGRRMTPMAHAMANVEYAQWMSSYFHGTEYQKICQALLADGLSRVAVEHWERDDRAAFDRYAADSLLLRPLSWMPWLRCRAPRVYLSARAFRRWVRARFGSVPFAASDRNK